MKYLFTRNYHDGNALLATPQFPPWLYGFEYPNKPLLKPLNLKNAKNQLLRKNKNIKNVHVKNVLANNHVITFTHLRVHGKIQLSTGIKKLHKRYKKCHSLSVNHHIHTFVFLFA